VGFDHPELANIIAGFFGCMIGVFWWLCFMRGLMDENVKPLEFPERFDIGYIDEPQQQVVVVQEKPKKKKKKRKSAPNTGPRHVCTKPKGPSDELLNDCVGALVSLGTRRGEARRVAAKTLVEKPGIETVEKFINEVFKRN
jgi:hypothetical protein